LTSNLMPRQNDYRLEVTMLAYVIVLVAVAFRFLPHPFSFTPVGASLLFFGARAPRKRIWVPVALLAISDVVLTTVVYKFPLSIDHLVTWAWYAGACLLGGRLRGRVRALRLAGTSLALSLSFFLASNFAVWAVWNMYPKTPGGLMAAYVAGLPFFKNTLASDLFFTAVIFATPALIELLSRSVRKPERDPAAAA